jgi:hypothetical protein
MTHSGPSRFLDIGHALPNAGGAETRVGWQRGPHLSTRYFSLSLILLFSMLAFLFPCSALAVRPFITDDARIAAPREFQVETSLRIDKERFQNLNVFSLGILEKLEASLNFIDGFMLEDETKYNLSIAGPGFQLKYLFTDGKTSVFPGVALVAGFVPPWGAGSQNFSPPSWSDYLYLAVTKYFFKDFESLNLHANLGFTNSYDEQVKTNTTWGVGVQAHLVEKLYLCTEVFSGDPYAITPGALFQIGLRYFISDRMQIDLSTGRGLYGDPMLDYYAGFGFRVIFDNFVRK